MKFNVSVDGFGTFNTSVGAGGTVTPSDVASIIHSATSKITPVDADELPLIDSAASNVLKKLTWANLKAALKTYFDAIYLATRSFGTAAALDVGTTANKVVQLTAAAKLPAVDGSLLTNIPGALPSQATNSGKLLTTDGSTASWGIIPGTVATLDTGVAIGDVPLFADDGQGRAGLSIPGTVAVGDLTTVVNWAAILQAIGTVLVLESAGTGGEAILALTGDISGTPLDFLILANRTMRLADDTYGLEVTCPALIRDTTIAWQQIDGQVAVLEAGAKMQIGALAYVNDNDVFLSWGANSPEGVLTASPGSIYGRTNGGAGTSFYVKESGTGSTGWIAK